MKIKTSELTGPTLDWAVAQAAGITVVRQFPGWAYIPKVKRTYYKWVPSDNWKQGGPIIERERLYVEPWINGHWMSCHFGSLKRSEGTGPTPLIAAMRCFVASKLGDEVDVPDNLLIGEKT